MGTRIITGTYQGGAAGCGNFVNGGATWKLPGPGTIGWYSSYFFPTSILKAAAANWGFAATTPDTASMDLDGFEFDGTVPVDATITAVQFRLNAFWPRPLSGPSPLNLSVGAQALVGGSTLTNHTVNVPPTDPVDPMALVLVYYGTVRALDLTADRSWAPADFTTANFKARLSAHNPNAAYGDGGILVPLFFDGVTGGFAPQVVVTIETPEEPVSEFRTWSHMFLLADVVSAGLRITTTCPISGATRGSHFSFALEAEGGSGPLTWSKTGGTLPPGLRLNRDGSISGTPRESGAFPITIKVRDT